MIDARKLIVITLALFCSKLAHSNECQLKDPDLMVSFSDNIPHISTDMASLTHIGFADMKLSLEEGRLSEEDSMMFLSVLSEYYLAESGSTSITFFNTQDKKRDYTISVDAYFQLLLQDKACANALIGALRQSRHFS